MVRLNTTSQIASEKTVLHCPACKKKLEPSGNEYSCRSCHLSFPVVDDIPLLVISQAACDGFDASEFACLFQMEQKHFWHVGRKEIILDVLKRNIPDLAGSRMLEVGCGNGNVLAFLKNSGIDVEGGDIFTEGLAFCRQRLNSVPLYQLDVLALPFRDEFDIAGLFDVLEHIEDDTKALTEIRLALKPGGRLLVTVPAYRFLWSYFDVRSNHKRRYGKAELVNRLELAGFTVRKASYFMFFLFPVLAAVRLMGKAVRRKDNQERAGASLEMKTIPVLNDIFLGLLRFEKVLLRRFNFPFGASLIVLAERVSRNEN